MDQREHRDLVRLHGDGLLDLSSRLLSEDMTSASHYTRIMPESFEYAKKWRPKIFVSQSRS